MNRVRPFWVLGVWLISVLPIMAQTGGVRFQFREPHSAAYHIEIPRSVRSMAANTNDWLRGTRAGSTNETYFSSRLALQLQDGDALAGLISGRPLRLIRTVAPGLFVLQAPDAWTALVQAEQLSQLAGVASAHPVARRPRQLYGAYAPQPNDPYFKFQWYLENRDAEGQPMGPDLNVRSAWPLTRGEGVTIAICDDGFELNHPDLAARAGHTNHYNFGSRTTNGNPSGTFSNHATAVAGLAGAEGGNGVGISGVAPGAKLASYVIFNANGALPDDLDMVDMYQYRSNSVAVQNHSWGSGSVQQSGPSALELTGISNAIVNGRNGLGTVMVRAGGNNRAPGGNANDDFYAADPRVIAVAAVRSDGRATRYSSPGAPLLVAAPSAEVSSGGFGIDAAFPALFTTDRAGSLRGYNQISFTNDFADYVFDSLGFSGTSGSAPQVAGLAALILSVNPNLSYRDVQQILVFSARQFDLADQDLVTNAAGLRVSHNTGFGVPDAGVAVRLAAAWPSRPPPTNVTYAASPALSIPDGALRVIVSQPGVPESEQSYLALPSLGPHVDTSTPVLPLVDVGQALGPLTTNLTGKAALIERGINFFYEKINHAAAAGAAFAVVFNNTAVPSHLIMGETDYLSIPAVFISQAAGTTVRNFLQTNGSGQARIVLNKAVVSYAVTNHLLCEHVSVKIGAGELSRQGVRVTLVSPAGTRSVLQPYNNDSSALSDWTYTSTHHFFEPSFGTWQVEVSNETNALASATMPSTLMVANLTIAGVAITDSDHDGLDDDWEIARFGSLGQGPLQDPDGDGYSNLREQIMGSNPTVAEIPFNVDLSKFNEGRVRLSWPSSTNYAYQVITGPQLAGPQLSNPTTVTNLTGKFPETEIFLSSTNLSQQFFRIERSPLVQ